MMGFLGRYFLLCFYSVPSSYSVNWPDCMESFQPGLVSASASYCFSADSDTKAEITKATQRFAGVEVTA